MKSIPVFSIIACLKSNRFQGGERSIYLSSLVLIFVDQFTSFATVETKSSTIFITVL